MGSNATEPSFDLVTVAITSGMLGEPLHTTGHEAAFLHLAQVGPDVLHTGSWLIPALNWFHVHRADACEAAPVESGYEVPADEPTGPDHQDRIGGPRDTAAGPIRFWRGAGMSVVGHPAQVDCAITHEHATGGSSGAACCVCHEPIACFPSLRTRKYRRSGSTSLREAPDPLARSAGRAVGTIWEGLPAA